MALIGDVQLLILDEPSTGLDPWAQVCAVCVGWCSFPAARSASAVFVSGSVGNHGPARVRAVICCSCCCCLRWLWLVAGAPFLPLTNSLMYVWGRRSVACDVTQLDLWKMLQRWRAASPTQHTMVLCTHDMTEAELLCDTFALLNDGHLVVRDVTAGVACFHPYLACCCCEGRGDYMWL
jgi:hypothetical protein